MPKWIKDYIATSNALGADKRIGEALTIAVEALDLMRTGHVQINGKNVPTPEAVWAKEALRRINKVGK